MKRSGLWFLISLALLTGCQDGADSKAMEIRLDSTARRWEGVVDSLASVLAHRSGEVDSLLVVIKGLESRLDSAAAKTLAPGRPPRKPLGDPIKWGDK